MGRKECIASRVVLTIRHSCTRAPTIGLAYRCCDQPWEFIALGDDGLRRARAQVPRGDWRMTIETFLAMDRAEAERARSADGPRYRIKSRSTHYFRCRLCKRAVAGKRSKLRSAADEKRAAGDRVVFWPPAPGGRQTRQRTLTRAPSK